MFNLKSTVTLALCQLSMAPSHQHFHLWYFFRTRCTQLM